MDAQLVVLLLGPQLNLSQHLIGEGVAHHKAGVAVSTAKVNQTTFSQNDQVTTALHCVAINLNIEDCVFQNWYLRGCIPMGLNEALGRKYNKTAKSGEKTPTF